MASSMRLIDESLPVDESATLVPASAGPRELEGGFETLTLNHMVSPTTIEEWVKLVENRDSMLARIDRTSVEIARMESHLLLAGVSRDRLNRALADRVKR